ncbi:MAG: VOC family protein, partial [Rubricoccaceae bacterium]|nr:VOC family protein [Rubricoccaceae bacterium]
PQDIPTVGRFAICQDPQGAIFAVFTPLGDPPGLQGQPRPKSVSWHELGSTDAKAGVAFYRKVFNWGDAGTHDMGEELGDYDMFDAGAWPVGGAYTIPKSMEGMPPCWTPYIMTDDLDAACERVTAGGGKIVNGPMEVPGGSHVAVCMDNVGAAFGLHEAGPEMAEGVDQGSVEAAA